MHFRQLHCKCVCKCCLYLASAQQYCEKPFAELSKTKTNDGVSKARIGTMSEGKFVLVSVYGPGISIGCAEQSIAGCECVEHKFRFATRLFRKFWIINNNFCAMRFFDAGTEDEKMHICVLCMRIILPPATTFRFIFSVSIQRCCTHFNRVRIGVSRWNLNLFNCHKAWAEQWAHALYTQSAVIACANW